MAGYTKMVYPEMVTHPSINQDRCRVTVLIDKNVLPLSQANCQICTPNAGVQPYLFTTVAPETAPGAG